MSDRFNDIDLAITEDGDLMLDGNGDFLSVTDLDYVVQTIKCRLKTVNTDWFYDNIGANIEETIGMPNSKENADKLTQRIVDALIIDNFCSIEDILVLARPINASRMIVAVFVNTEFLPNPIEFKIDFNFLTGFNIT